MKYLVPGATDEFYVADCEINVKLREFLSPVMFFLPLLFVGKLSLLLLKQRNSSLHFGNIVLKLLYYLTEQFRSHKWLSKKKKSYFYVRDSRLPVGCNWCLRSSVVLKTALNDSYRRFGTSHVQA
jgi:hypothetical protein